MKKKETPSIKKEFIKRLKKEVKDPEKVTEDLFEILKRFTYY